MSVPTQMYDHVLDPVKGWPSPYALDKTVSMADPTDTIRAGMVCSLDANALVVPGLAVDAMGLFAFQNDHDFDVVGDDGNLVGNGAGQFYGTPDITGTVTPRINFLVATGSYELESTEFDTLQTYNPNTCLTSDLPGGAAPGELTPGTPYFDTLCGVVSDGVLVNNNKKSVLRFWTVWLPVMPSADSTVPQQ